MVLIETSYILKGDWKTMKVLFENVDKSKEKETLLALPYLYAKRIIDILFSFLLLIVLSPLFLVIACAIKLEDGGKVIYRHPRIGYMNNNIGIYKFRSMRDSNLDLKELLTKEQYEEYLKEFKLDNDPRITKVGSLLRKTSLDELPQLFNILKGDMSLVGPRPIIEEEFVNYSKLEKEKLLSVKPGLTGYWQAYARNNASYQTGERQRMELYYIDHTSVWLDIKVLFKTVQTVITRKGAK